MNYVINEDICKKKGMDLPSLLAVLLVKTGVNITELFNDLVNKEVLVKDMFSEGFLVTQRWDIHALIYYLVLILLYHQMSDYYL